MLKPIIELCSSNLRHGTYKFVKHLEDSEKYDVIQYGCLGNCGQCFAEPYAYVEGEIISAETKELFEEAMIRKLKEIEPMYLDDSGDHESN